MNYLLYFVVVVGFSLTASNADTSLKRSPRGVPDIVQPIENSSALQFVEAARQKTNLPGNNVPLSVFLWQSTKMYQKQALNSAYVQGIKKANLDPEGFGGYMIQDSVFCYRAKQNIDIAANNASDVIIRDFLQARSASYNAYYDALAKTWHIKDPNGIDLNEACSNYINHEHNVAMTYDSVYFVVAMTPCAKLWPWLGQQIGVSSTATFGVYTDWARTNFNPDDSGVAKYEKIINEAERQGKIDRQKALEVYAGSMKGEADFFNSVKAV